MKVRRTPLGVLDVADHGDGQILMPEGMDLFYSSEYGRSRAPGTSWDKASNSMEQLFEKIDALPSTSARKSNGTIHVSGDVRGALTAPLGAYGWKIQGAFHGRPRHVTNNGVVSPGNGAAWRQAAVADGAPLLTLREQGWEIRNFLMVPESGYGAVKLRREETATYPDASHFRMADCRIIGPGTRVGLGIDDAGASYNIEVLRTVFENLEYAYHASGVGIAAPYRHRWLHNTFVLNKNDIVGNFHGSLLRKNAFRTAYNAGTHPKTVYLNETADAGGATDPNLVVENYFADAAADVAIAKGYKPATGDIWRNYVTDTAAFIVTVPA